MARPAGRVERAWKWARRRPAVAAAYGLLALAVVLASAGAGVLALWRQAEQARGQAEQAKAKEETVKEQLEQVLYLRRAAGAYAEWKDNEVARAKRLLADCPLERRHWEWHYVSHLAEGSRLILQGHTSEVLSVCFSPDSRRLASASWIDSTVKIWDAAPLVDQPAGPK